MSYPQLLTPEEKLADAKQRLNIPHVVVICGSTRFMADMVEANLQETADGNIVVAPGCNMKEPHPRWADPLEAERLKGSLDQLHRAKIRLADEVLVVGDYIGVSTRSEIRYARALGKPIRFTHPEARTRRLAEHMTEEHAPKPETTSATDQGPSERLAEIEARTQAATEGPWGTYDDGTGRIDIAADMRHTGHGYRCRRQVAQTIEMPIDNDQAHEHWTEEDDQRQIEADAEFVTQARADVPWLIQRVRELEAELHSCDNCEGVDPASRLMNSGRPA